MKKPYIRIIASALESEPYWLIMFIDGTGQSILAKTKNISTATNIADKFDNDLKNGVLLKPYKSAYKQ